MPTLRDRVVKLEERVDAHDERIEALEEWLSDESKLRAIAQKHIELLREADAIHERRIDALSRQKK